MKIVAVTSACGGAGKTTIVASLAVLLARRQMPALAIELNQQNVLSTFLGLPDVPLAGLVTHALEREGPWRSVTYRNDEGILFVPFGRAETACSAAFDAALADDPDWLTNHLRMIDLPRHAVVLLDAARFPDVKARQAIRCADLALCVTRPDPLANVSLAQHIDVLRQGSHELRIVVNGVSPAHPLHYDMLTMLRARVGSDTVLPLRIHLDSAVPVSYAHGAHCFDFAPHSQAAHDLQGLANWLAAWVRKDKAY